MQEIDNCSEKNINNDYILFKRLNEDSPFKSKRPKQQISLFDINNNNKLTTDTFEDYILKMKKIILILYLMKIIKMINQI